MISLRMYSGELFMGLEDLGVIAVKSLLPPRTPNDEHEQQRWRWVVFSAILIIGSGLVIHVVIACGLIPQLSTGFALSTSVGDLKSQVSLIAAQSLETSMRNKITDRCRAKDASFKQELTEDIDKLDREYFSIEHTYYREPTCESLL